MWARWYNVIMITYLSGKVQNKGNSFIILRAGDIGYKVHVNTALYADCQLGEIKEVYTHQYVREDALDLYGFKNMEELELFELLLSISGIGPKTALGVLAVGSVADIKESIARGDAHLLTKVSGIGKKTAERVVLELREKVGALGFGKAGGAEAAGSGLSSDEIDALMALGYSLSDARDALRQVDVSIKDSRTRIKEALRKLSKS